MKTEFETFAYNHDGDNISNEYIPEPFVELIISLLRVTLVKSMGRAN